MLVLHANQEQEATFNKLIQTMGEPVAWNGRFVVIGDALILEGGVRSFVFQFDTRRVKTDIIELSIKEEEVLEIAQHPGLQDLINMILYAFGKWGTLRGLRVEQDYPQLNRLFGRILGPYYIEPSFQKENFRFYKEGMRITYEDVVETALKFEEQPEDEPGAEAQGLWHKLVWKNRERIFKKTETTLEQRQENRIGNNFYLVGYQCPKCAEKLHMAVYPQGKEVRIDTDEKGVYLARAYTCSDCCCFYTPRPGRLIAEGMIYEMSFDGDRKAYEDYLELLGQNAERTANFQYNEYEALRNQRLKREQKEAEHGQDDPDHLRDAEDALHQLEDFSRRLAGLSDAVFRRFAHRIEEGFYPDDAVAEHEPEILEQERKRNLEAEKQAAGADGQPEDGSGPQADGRAGGPAEAAGKDGRISADTGSGQAGSGRTPAGAGDGRTGGGRTPAGGRENGQPGGKGGSRQAGDGRAGGKGGKGGSRQAGDGYAGIGDGPSGFGRAGDAGGGRISAGTEDAGIGRTPAGAGGMDTGSGQAGSGRKPAGAEDGRTGGGRTPAGGRENGQPDGIGAGGRQAGGGRASQQMEKYEARLGVLERLSDRQKLELKKQIQYDAALNDSEKKQLLRPIEEAEWKAKTAAAAKKAESAKNRSFRQIHKVMKEIENEELPAQEKRALTAQLREWSRQRGEQEVRQLMENVPQRLDRAGYQKLEEKLHEYEGVDLSPYQETLRQKREAAEKQEIANIVKRSRKASREDYVGLMRRLEEQDFDDENTAPYMEKIQEKVRRMDEAALEGILDHVQQMDFDTAAAAYEKITQENFLPELKNNAVEMLTRRLEKIRTEECELLVRKLQDEMRGTIKENPRHHFYPAKKVMLKTAEPEETRAVDAALSTYAAGRNLFEYPIFTVDTSRNHSGREGMALTPEHLFYGTRHSAYVVPVSSIDSIQASTGLLNRRITLEEANGARHKLPYAVGTGEMTDWAGILEGFVRYLQEKPASRKLEYLAKETHNTICCFRCGHVYSGSAVCPECGYKKNR